MSSPSFGRVIWAELLDPQGRNPKCRPAIIITPTDDITPDGKVRVVAISTRLDAAPPEVQVPLQYDPRGACRTGLREPCVAVCNWIVHSSLTTIRDYAGRVPGKTMYEIGEKIKRAEGVGPSA